MSRVPRCGMGWLGWVGAVGVIAAVGSGCTLHLFSPPARLAPTELSSNMEKGQVEVIANAGGHGEMFNPVSPVHVQASVAYGVSDQAAVQATVSYVRLRADEDVDYCANQNVISFRAGAGFSPRLPRQFLRLTAGLGGGSSAAGGFVAPDVGMNLAFDNRFVVPFVNSSFWISFPGEDASVVVRYPDQVESGEVDEFGEPVLVDGFRVERFPVSPTRGILVSVGIAVRLGGWRRPVDWAAGESPRGPVLMVAAQHHYLRDNEASIGFWGWTGGVMHRF